MTNRRLSVLALLPGVPNQALNNGLERLLITHGTVPLAEPVREHFTCSSRRLLQLLNMREELLDREVLQGDRASGAKDARARDIQRLGIYPVLVFDPSLLPRQGPGAT